jgi:hydrogenase maturation protease
MAQPIPVLIIGLGNEYRGDDAAGLTAARRFKNVDTGRIKVVDDISDGTALMEAWSNGEKVYIIDAVVSGAKPGTIHRFDGRTDIIPKRYFNNYSTHSLNIIESLELGKVLGNLPPSIIIYGIEGKDFSHGVGLSREVEKAVDNVVSSINKEIEEILELNKEIDKI